MVLRCADSLAFHSAPARTVDKAMTEFEQMTDEELRLAIAKAKGGKISYRPGAPDSPMVTMDKHVYEVSRFGWLELDSLGDKTPTWFCRDWPTDIAAAWELVGDMLYYDIKSIAKGKVVAVLYPERNLLKAKVGKSNTTPRAICIAWLKWQEATK